MWIPLQSRFISWHIHPCKGVTHFLYSRFPTNPIYCKLYILYGTCLLVKEAFLIELFNSTNYFCGIARYYTIVRNLSMNNRLGTNYYIVTNLCTHNN